MNRPGRSVAYLQTLLDGRTRASFTLFLFLCSCFFLAIGVKHTAYYAWVIAIIIESGATYTACLICELVLYTRNNTGTLLIVGILSQMAVRPSSLLLFPLLS